MKFLFATLQYVETDFYARVGGELRERGHEVAHLTYSRRAASVLRRRGELAECLPELMRRAVPDGSWEDEEARILARYGIASLRDVHRSDPPCRAGADEERCGRRTIRHFLAIERLFDRIEPELVVPEVGNESIRTVSHLVAKDQGATTLFLMYTLFDEPLRLYANTMDAPIVPTDELRSLTPEEERELDDFIARFTARNSPIRDHRRVRASPRRIGVMLRHLAVRGLWDRDNEYLTPVAWIARDLRRKARELAARALYAAGAPRRPFVYFPLQVADDYKLLRLRPALADQEPLVTAIVEGLPPDVDVVVKEHPMSIGRNSLGMLRRLAAMPRVRVADPYVSSLDLVRDAAAVATISSTVGLEALLFNRPVLTVGRPFYAGYGVTLDLDAGELRERAAEVLEFSPEAERTRRLLHAAMRHCYPGAPVLVDSSNENAARLAATLDRAARGELGDRHTPSLTSR